VPAADASDSHARSADGSVAADPSSGLATDLLDEELPEATGADMPAGSAEATGPAALPVSFQPMLQVDQFDWPEVCGHLARQAGDALEELTSVLRRLARCGHKVIGLTSAQSGQGTTTTLLTAARHLAERGISVAMVDAATRNPQLAARLCVAPEFGWEAIPEGCLPLEEYLIESVADRVALLPLCRTFADEARQPQLLEAFGTSVAELRRHYEVVLVDLGTLVTDQAEPAATDARRSNAATEGSEGDSLPAPLVLARAANAALLVRDARRLSGRESLTLHRRLARAGVTVAGTVETFVPTT
jgi:Mrp family chromosome partitioning ATPase